MCYIVLIVDIHIPLKEIYDDVFNKTPVPHTPIVGDYHHTDGIPNYSRGLSKPGGRR